MLNIFKICAEKIDFYGGRVVDPPPLPLIRDMSTKIKVFFLTPSLWNSRKTVFVIQILMFFLVTLSWPPRDQIISLEK